MILILPFQKLLNRINLGHKNIDRNNIYRIMIIKYKLEKLRDRLTLYLQNQYNHACASMN